ncbi:MAG: T9SS type A sorting domain-containing protein [Bacteroidales bacterium]|nr:T9SS type A sorting domain-containing protein [Bacteroidales bacterium]MCB8999351.1 T9SS type A sorting domain-containing protein [Bacteroidales bacterium]MCB9013406.1 T9SS type A sorting domain-containing protein [Bacteroidales bacterium]
MKKCLLILFVLLALSPRAFTQTQTDTIFTIHADTPVTIDGQATEDCWANTDWHPISQVWIPWHGSVSAADFTGKFKVAWDSLYLYVLVDVTDDSLSDDHSDPLIQWYDDDCVEVFIDENRSKGFHQTNNNAFAYHVSIFYDVIDLNSSGGPVNYKNNIEVVMDTVAPHKYLWEMAIKNYSSAFNVNDPEASRVKLSPNKLMGFTIAYCDNDKGTTRENFIGSMNMTSATANDNYITADYFGSMKLMPPATTRVDQKVSENEGFKVFPVPSSDEISVELGTSGQFNNRLSVKTMAGREIKSLDFTENKISFSIEDMEAGMYVLSLKNENTSESRIFIKQ